MSNFEIIKACVIGWPIKHSRSPLIHQYWLKQYEILGSYEKLAVMPDGLDDFLKQIGIDGLQGCNVTIPHKEKVFEKVLVTDPVTQKIGAVNTVYYEQGKVFGLNTDGFGFLSNLKSVLPGWNSAQKKCVIIGAGGAARAIIAVLLDDNIGQITLVNRTIEKAQNLAMHFGSLVFLEKIENLDDCLADCDLLINTTALGMIGQPPLQISLKKFPRDSVVADIVYAPLETNLLRQAKQNGNQTIDGLGMLLHQAVSGFEKWFGLRPEVTPDLRDLIIADLMKDKI